MRLLLLAALLPAIACAHDDFPTGKQISELLAATPEKAEAYTLDKTLIRTVYLTTHEKAYLVPVSLPDEGRNGGFRTALVRPEINKAQVLPSVVKNVEAVYDLNEDRVSEVVATETYSGGGTSEGTKTLVNLDGWTPLVLLEREFSDNAGVYDRRNSEYYKVGCWWDFWKPEQFTGIELQERCEDEKGGGHENIQKTKRAFRLVDGVLAEVPWQPRVGLD